MKFKKPEIIQMFKTSGGATVGTLDEWKKAELTAITGGADSSSALADALLKCADDVIGILAVKEPKGRPVGAKDKKPRKKAVSAPEGA